MGNKILIIGLDGATFDLIHPWVSDGKLPTFRKLLAEGAYGILRSSVPPITPPAWTSFTTGKNPGKHGLFDFLKIDGNYNFGLNTSLDKGSREFWEYTPGKSIIINLPVSYPPKKTNGYMVTGILTPGIGSNFTYPKNLGKEILAKIPNYRIELMWELYEGKKEEFLRDLYQMTEARFKLIRIMLEKEWDVFFAVFIGTDRIQHLCWNDEDLLQYYKKIDGYLDEILKGMDRDTTLFIVSDHGFGEVHKLFHCNAWLMREGYLSTKKESIPFRVLKKIGFKRDNIIKVLKFLRIDLASLRAKLPERIKNVVPQEEMSVYRDVDWSRTEAFMVGFGQIFINAKERFSRGVVGPERYEKLRNELIQKFRKIRDPETGELIVQSIHKKEDVYKGPYLAEAPDLIVELKRGYALSTKVKEKITEGSGFMKADHAKNGIFIVYGRNIEKGKEVEASIVDIAPTILHIRGVSIPKDMDGRVLKEIFKAGSKLGKRLLRYREIESEKEEIKQRVRLLKEKRRI